VRDRAKGYYANRTPEQIENDQRTRAAWYQKNKKKQRRQHPPNPVLRHVHESFSFRFTNWPLSVQRNLAIVVDDPVPEAAFFAFAHAAAEVDGFPSLRRRATGRTNSARPKSRRYGVRCGATRSST